MSDDGFRKPSVLPSRREILKHASTGFGILALAGLMAEQSRADGPPAPTIVKSVQHEIVDRDRISKTKSAVV